MNRLPKDKRNQLILVTGLTLVVVAALWAVLISPSRQRLRGLSERKAALAHKLDQVTSAIKNTDRVSAELAAAHGSLTALETHMASGDLYSWAVNMLREFKTPYHVDIPSISQIDGPREMSLLPRFPYKQATVTIGGSGYFYDFGQFLADFENKAPYLRVLNLSLEPIPSTTVSDQDKLAFKMDVVFLVKPGDA